MSTRTTIVRWQIHLHLISHIMWDEVVKWMISLPLHSPPVPVRCNVEEVYQATDAVDAGVTQAQTIFRCCVLRLML